MTQLDDKGARHRYAITAAGLTALVFADLHDAMPDVFAKPNLDRRPAGRPRRETPDDSR